MSMRNLIPWAVAAVTGFLASMLYSIFVDWETTGGVALMVIPHLVVAVVLALVAQSVWTDDTVKYAAFLLPLLFPIFLAVSTLWACEGARMDGVPEIARFLAGVCLVALLTGCVCLILLDLGRTFLPRNHGEAKQ